MKSTNKGAGCLAMLALGGLLVGYLVMNDTPEKKAKRDASDLPGLACLMAQEFVKQQLKAPKSAEFSSCYNSDSLISRTQITPARFTVFGHVDAENSFSAKIRNKYMVVVEQLPDDNSKWRLIDLKM